MTTSPARFDASHSESWRFSRNGHGVSHSHNHSFSHGQGNAGDRPAPRQAARKAPESKFDPYTEALVARVAKVCDGQKPTPLAQRLSLHPETVRRYINGQRPSPEFLAALCREMGIAPEWLLLGEGDMHRPGHG